MKFFDAHIHADCRSTEEIETMSLFGTYVAVTLAVGLGYTAPASVLDYFQKLVRDEPRRAERYALRLRTGLGLHPLTVGRDNAAVLQALPALLAQRGVVALGEVGLEKGTEAEVELLNYQLAIAREQDLPVVVHTPEANKLSLTGQVLKLVEGAQLKPHCVLIDHVDAETFALVKSSGYWVGLTVHPRGLTPQGAACLLQAHGVERVILSSDVGRDPADLWSLPRTALECRRLGLSPDAVEPAFFANASRFYSLDGSRW